MPFEKARKERRKLRLSLQGPSKSGKTNTALIIASALGEKIALADSENRTSEIYADRFDFDVDHLADHHPRTYEKSIAEAVEKGYDVWICDSVSHAWAGRKGILELVDSETPSGGSAFTSGWNKVRPIESSFWQAILGAPIHVIVTMRVKTAYNMEEQEKRGKVVSVPVKVGLAPIQRDGVEYEFDIVASMDLGHTLTIEGSRYAQLAEGQEFEKPDKDFGILVRSALDEGEEPTPPAEAEPAKVEFLKSCLLAEGREERKVEDTFQQRRVANRGALAPEWVEKETAAAIKRLEAAGKPIPGATKT